MWRSSVGVMALLVVMGACGNRTGDSGAEDSGAAGADASRPLSEVHMNYDDQYGLDLWARFTPLRDGRVVNATMVAAGRSVPAYGDVPELRHRQLPTSDAPEAEGRARHACERLCRPALRRRVA